MNLLIFEPEEVGADGLVRLTDQRRRQHLSQILRVNPGDSLRAGVLAQGLGRAEVISVETDHIALRYAPNPDLPSPVLLACELVLALPRPLVLKRLLSSLGSLGVSRIHLLHTARVEKSYWQSPQLAPDQIKRHLLLGLEQGGATQLPEVQMHRRFRPFAEDLLPELCHQAPTLLVHPGSGLPCPADMDGPVNLLIGPEGGWVPYEVELMQQAGAQTVHLGPRILRVEDAVVLTLGRIFKP